MIFNDVAIISIKRNDYIIHFWYMSKDDTIRLMNNFNLNEKTGLHYIYKNMSESKTTYYQRNKDVVLKRAKDYHRNNKDELKVKARNKEY